MRRPLCSASLLAAACSLSVAGGPSAFAQSITASDDVLINGSPAASNLGDALNANSVDIAHSNGGSGGLRGRLALENGASADVSSTTVGGNVNATLGLLDLSGFGTDYQTDTLRIGTSEGRGVVQVLAGAGLAADSSIELGDSQGGEGVLTLDGFSTAITATGSFRSGSGTVSGGSLLEVNGLQLGNGGVFDLRVNDRGRVRAQGLLVGSANGGTGSSLAIDSGGAVDSDSAQINPGSLLTLDDGTLNLTGSTGSNFLNVSGGSLEGSGRVNGFVRVEDGGGVRGRLTVASGDTLRVQQDGQLQTSVVNGGLVEVDGTLDLGASTFVNNQDGSYLGRGGTFRGFQFQNEGQGAAVDLVSGDNAFDAEFRNSQGRRVTVTGGATAVFQQDFFNDGRLRIDGGSRATFTGDYVGNLAEGAGEAVILGNLRFSARQTVALAAFSPSAAPQPMTAGTRDPQPIGGTIDLRGGSLTLGFEADGTFDAFNFTNEDARLLLDETPLDFNLADGFDPENGDRFEVFRFFEGGSTQIEGTFAIRPEDLALGGGLSFDASELETTGFLTVVPEPGSIALLLGGAGLLLRRRRA